MISAFSKGKKNSIDENALEILFNEYYDMVYKTAYSIVLDKEHAKEATQEAFIKAFRKIETLKDKSKFGPWVRTITVNVSKDILRKVILNRKNSMPIYDAEGKLKEYIHELADYNTPENIYENTAIIKELRHWISQLDIDTQMIISFKYYHDYTYKKIAETMDMKEGTVKIKLHRAKQKIANNIENFFDKKGVEDNNAL